MVHRPAPRSEGLPEAIGENRATAFCGNGTIKPPQIETDAFDVFLCHNSEDKPAVKEIGEQLKKRGYLPWLDEWEIPPFVPWQEELQKVIHQIKAAAIFVGRTGVWPWEDMEIKAFGKFAWV